MSLLDSRTMYEAGKEACAILNANRKQGWLVGGALRDLLMGRKLHDIDIATNALPEETKEIFKSNGITSFFLKEGEKFGTVGIKLHDVDVEITTFRTEKGYSDSRHPDEVVFRGNIYEDLRRRDFTINAIAYAPTDKMVYDPFQGIYDLYSRTIKAVLDPLERFKEDPLRILRAFRFSSQLGFVIEEDTLKACNEASPSLSQISGERIREEILKILSTSRAEQTLYFMPSVLMSIFPEMKSIYGRKQSVQWHRYDVLIHSIKTMSVIPETKPLMRFAALFHDIGKGSRPDNAGFSPEDNHVDIGVKITNSVMKRLGFSNEEIDKVLFLIANHMKKVVFNTSQNLPHTVRRFLNKTVGNRKPEDAYDLIEFCIADTVGSGKEKLDTLCQALEFSKEIDSVLKEEQAFTRKQLKINGDDLLAEGFPATKKIGDVLDLLVTMVIDDPTLNTRENLLDRVKLLKDE